MNKISLFVLITLILHLSAFQLTKSLQIETTSVILSKDPPKTVPYVDLIRYAGVWYQQSSIPQKFQANCTNTNANYSLNDDGTIKVTNTCYRDGIKNQMIGKAYPDPADTQKTNAKLKVRFPFSISDADYWVVRLDDSYSYAVVASPNYEFLWILYRSPIMPQQFYNTLYEDLKNDEFPVEKLVKTKQ